MADQDTTSPPSKTPTIPSKSKYESDIVKIIVGKENAQRFFFIHQDLLAPSKFFQACINSGFRKSSSKVIDLPQDDLKAVDMFIKWVYTGKYDTTDFNVANTASTFSFGDKIYAERFCNDLMDALRSMDRVEKYFWGLKSIKHVFRVGRGETALGRYSVKSMVHQMQSSPQAFANLPDTSKIESFEIPEMMRDIVKEVVDFLQGPYAEPHSVEGCQFHKHEEGSTCTAVSAAKK